MSRKTVRFPFLILPGFLFLAFVPGFAPGGPAAASPEDLRAGKNFLPTAVTTELEDAKILALFKGLRVADVSDGMDAAGLQNIGLMDPEIHPLWRDTEHFTHRFSGVAVTARYVPTQSPPAGKKDIAAYDAWAGDWYDRRSGEPFMDLIRKGTALVIEDAPAADVGTIGSYNILEWKNLGCVGVVTSATARDTDEIITERVPLYLRKPGRGIRPGRNEIESVNRPVVCGGVLVRPGDIIVADGDGVVVVPRSAAADVAAYARKILDGDMEGRRELYKEAGLREDDSVRTVPAPFQKGIAFTGYDRNSYVGEGARLALRELAATNADWVQILVTAYQDTRSSTVIDRAGEETPTDASLVDIIRYAKELGLKVFLKPHIDLRQEPTHWRGEIGQGFSEADWAAWFSSYREFIVHYAGLAETLGADMFSAGCELNRTVAREADWRLTIAAIRGIYHGPLTYADDQVESNPDAVVWWDAVDLIGMDAYPTLTDEVNPSVVDFRAGWIRYLEKLHGLQKRWGKNVIITEIGYRSILGGAQNPWDWQRRGPVDLEVQANAYQAGLQNILGRGWLQGVYWWQWMPDPEDGGVADTGYSPHGKPAEQVLTAFYKDEFPRQ